MDSLSQYNHWRRRRSIIKAIWLVMIPFGAVQGFVIDRSRSIGNQRFGCRTGILPCRLSPLLEVWVEEADDDFLTRLETSKRVKFVSFPSKRLLPTLTMPRTSGCYAPVRCGAVKILDELFLRHLKSEPGSPWALRTFVLQCGSPDSEYSCASHMAGQLRGFRRLRDMVLIDSIYECDYYGDDLDGMVFDYHRGKRIYEQVARTDDWEVAAEIWMLLPDANSIKVCTVVKEQELDQ
ncbi:hypothetical protein MHU86_13949 [Fragilaria crotonensis]|nr:hypothetical protein MHU86_13949 [Fragilaria crotonensis]